MIDKPKIGDSVVVDDPEDNELYGHGFVGTIADVNVNETMILVEAQDGEKFWIEKKLIERTIF